MIIGAGIAPHGSLILPASENDGTSASIIHESMKKLANHIQNLKPDIIFISSPHGIALETSFGMYKNAIAVGTAEWKEGYEEYRSKLPLDTKITTEILQTLKEKGHKIEGITTYSAGETLPIRWGEVVPTWFLQEIKTDYMVLTQPTRRLNQALDMIPELVKLGQDVCSYLQNLNKKVFVLISGDMAHTYQADGPYGIHPSAQPFDNAVEKWAKTMDKKFLVEEAGSMLYSALACGFTGFVFLDSVLKSTKQKIIPEVFCNLHPTYYGMMVAKFEINN